ncbi:hypothetical protein H1R20_g6272, partial [Candolleomyces eurysporus]
MDSDSAVVATHAFVIDFASDLRTGNFVPEGEKPPNDMLDYQCKREPGLQAQVSLAFDTREDKSVYRCLKTIEDWLSNVSDFNTLKKPRSTWMSPEKENEANHHRYIVSSSLFQKRTTFNCPDGKYSVNYEVHPWIERNCVPHNRSWIPNPSLVSVLDGLTGTLIDIRDASDSELEQGDIVKIKFKVVRVGRVDSSGPQNPVHSGDHVGVILLKPGSKLALLSDKDQSVSMKEERTEGGSPDWGSIKEEEEDFADQTTGQPPDSDLSEGDDIVKVHTASKADSKGKRKANDEGDRKKRIVKARK